MKEKIYIFREKWKFRHGFPDPIRVSVGNRTASIRFTTGLGKEPIKIIIPIEKLKEKELCVYRGGIRFEKVENFPEYYSKNY